MTNREVFQKNFLKCMNESGYMQKDVARHLGIAKATVSAWATGRAYPRADVVQKLAQFFGVQMSDLVIATEEISDDEERLVAMFRSLSVTGKAKLLERAEELAVLYGGKTDNVPDRKVL